MDMKKRTADLLDKLGKTAPLVHNITNLVAMNSSANILLAPGASPVMAHSRREVADMAAMAGALVLDIGTLSQAWIEAMVLAARAANDHGMPVILDPVGAVAGDDDRLAATAAAFGFYGLCGELAVDVSRRPGSFFVA